MVEIKVVNVNCGLPSLSPSLQIIDIIVTSEACAPNSPNNVKFVAVD